MSDSKAVKETISYFEGLGETESARTAMNQIADESIQELRVDASNVKCKICFDTFFHPLMLSCQHTFCADCLISSCSKKFVRAIECALCRKRQELPRGSIKNLQVNRLILELLEENGKSGRIYNDSEFTSKLKRAGQYCRDIAASAKKSEDKIEDSSSEDSSSEESSSESDSSDSGTHSEINFGRLAVDSTSEDDSSYEDDSSGSSEEETSSEEESSEEEEYTP